MAMTNIKLLHQCFIPGYQLFPLFLIHYHWRSTQDTSLSRFRHLVPVGRLRFSPVHLACLCQRVCIAYVWECVCVCVHACLCIDVAVGVHTIGNEGEQRASATHRLVFLSAWQGRQTERRDDGSAVRGSARAAEAHLRMTLKVQRWRLSEIFRGHEKEGDKTCLSCHFADTQRGSTFMSRKLRLHYTVRTKKNDNIRIQNDDSCFWRWRV